MLASLLVCASFAAVAFGQTALMINTPAFVDPDNDQTNLLFLPSTDLTSFNWDTGLPAGQHCILFIVDSTGEQQNSAVFTIQPGTSTFAHTLRLPSADHTPSRAHRLRLLPQQRLKPPGLKHPGLLSHRDEHDSPSPPVYHAEQPAPVHHAGKPSPVHHAEKPSPGNHPVEDALHHAFAHQFEKHSLAFPYGFGLRLPVVRPIVVLDRGRACHGRPRRCSKTS
ncbi:hypothetical protein B0H19DRAFT_1146922 [Mycena capillaripes]|nr:hypothetical protein B0H19DRAFT_1146922 [Mycena capillaripes]